MPIAMGKEKKAECLQLPWEAESTFIWPVCYDAPFTSLRYDEIETENWMKIER